MGCGPSYYEDFDTLKFERDAQVIENQRNREILEVVAAYHKALEARDIETLRSLVSDDYYENAGTTESTEDDYGFLGVDAALGRLEAVEVVKCDIVVRDLRVEDDRAQIFYEYAFNYLFKVDGVPQWEAGRDLNRMDLIRDRDSGLWKIYGGL